MDGEDRMMGRVMTMSVTRIVALSLFLPIQLYLS